MQNERKGLLTQKIIEYVQFHSDLDANYKHMSMESADYVP